MADFTLMRFFTCMDQHVPLQITSLSESFVAHFTLMWLLSCMDQHVLLQITSHSESFLADFTLMWLLSGMDQHVAFDSSFRGERLNANVAGVHAGEVRRPEVLQTPKLKIRH